MPKWKQQSLAFRQAMQAASTPQDADAPKFGSKNFKPTHNEYSAAADDRTPCEFCGRKFNAEAAARHIPICE